MKINDIFNQTINEDYSKTKKYVAQRKKEREAFEKLVKEEDEDIDLDEFETDGLPIDLEQEELDAALELDNELDKINNMLDDLIDSKNPNSLIKVLSRIDKTQSIAKGLSDKLTKEIVKASNNMSIVKNEINAVLGREDVLQKKLDKLKD